MRRLLFALAGALGFLIVSGSTALAIGMVAEIVGDDAVPVDPARSPSDPSPMTKELSDPNSPRGPDFIVGGTSAAEPPRTRPSTVPNAPRKTTPAPEPLGPFVDVVALVSGNDFKCTGVQIAPNAVLTAAHCLPISAAVVGYRLDKAVDRLKIVRSFRAPRALDAALLMTEKPFKALAAPRRLGTDQSLPQGPLTLVGFGSTDSSGVGFSGEMMKVTVPVSGWGCDPHRASWSGCRPGEEFVLLSRPGQGDTCNGDSGGPVFEQTTGGRRLLGITSRRLPGLGVACGNGGIYTRVDILDPWIQRVLRHLPKSPQETT